MDEISKYSFDGKKFEQKRNLCKKVCNSILFSRSLQKKIYTKNRSENSME